MSEPQGMEDCGASQDGCRLSVSEYDEEVFELDQLFPGSITPKNAKSVSCQGKAAMWRANKGCQTPSSIAAKSQAEDRALVGQDAPKRWDEKPAASSCDEQTAAHNSDDQGAARSRDEQCAAQSCDERVAMSNS